MAARFFMAIVSRSCRRKKSGNMSPWTVPQLVFQLARQIYTTTYKPYIYRSEQHQALQGPSEQPVVYLQAVDTCQS